MKQSIRFCSTRDGVHLAVAVAGQGPLVLYVCGWPEHVEREWSEPFARSFLTRLASCCTLVRYDMRGSGLSDRSVGRIASEELLMDLEAIAAHFGEARYQLLALGMMAGPLALRFAARHPERVERIAMLSGFVRGDALMPVGRQQSLVAFVREFGFPHFDYVEGDGVGLEEQVGVRKIQRAGAPNETQAAVLEAMFATDLRAVLPLVVAPTLVCHMIDDPIVPFEAGRELAAALPNANFHSFPGTSAAPWAIVDSYLDRMLDFLGLTTPRFPAAEASVARLTPREQEVLILVSRGGTNASIGRQLGISEKTVKTHVSSVLSKLGASDRAHAAALAVTAGLLKA